MAHLLVNCVDTGLGALVSVVVWLPQKRTIVQQAVVNSPGVHSDAGHITVDHRHAAEDFIKKARNIPVERLAHLGRAVRESVEHLMLQDSLSNGATNDPAARCAQVNRQQCVGHRRKAAATPESTGM